MLNDFKSWDHPRKGIVVTKFYRNYHSSKGRKTKCFLSLNLHVNLSTVVKHSYMAYILSLVQSRCVVAGLVSGSLLPTYTERKANRKETINWKFALKEMFIFSDIWHFCYPSNAPELLPLANNFSVCYGILLVMVDFHISSCYCGYVGCIQWRSWKFWKRFCSSIVRLHQLYKYSRGIV